MNDLTFILLMRYFYLEKDLCTMNSPKHLSFSAKEDSQSVYEVSLQLPYMLNSKMILARGTGTDINSWENHCFSLSSLPLGTEQRSKATVERFRIMKEPMKLLFHGEKLPWKFQLVFCALKCAI